jgi:hypothetical protein
MLAQQETQEPTFAVEQTLEVLAGKALEVWQTEALAAAAETVVLVEVLAVQE